MLSSRSLSQADLNALSIINSGPPSRGGRIPSRRTQRSLGQSSSMNMLRSNSRQGSSQRSLEQKLLSSDMTRNFRKFGMRPKTGQSAQGSRMPLSSFVALLKDQGLHSSDQAALKLFRKYDHGTGFINLRDMSKIAQAARGSARARPSSHQQMISSRNGQIHQRSGMMRPSSSNRALLSRDRNRSRRRRRQSNRSNRRKTPKSRASGRRNGHGRLPSDSGLPPRAKTPLGLPISRPGSRAGVNSRHSTRSNNNTGGFDLPQVPAANLPERMQYQHNDQLANPTMVIDDGSGHQAQIFVNDQNLSNSNISASVGASSPSKSQTEKMGPAGICTLCRRTLATTIGESTAKIVGCGCQFHTKCIKDWYHRGGHSCPKCLIKEKGVPFIQPPIRGPGVPPSPDVSGQVAGYVPAANMIDPINTAGGRYSQTFTPDVYGKNGEIGVDLGVQQLEVERETEARIQQNLREQRAAAAATRQMMASSGNMRKVLLDHELWSSPPTPQPLEPGHRGMSHSHHEGQRRDHVAELLQMDKNLKEDMDRLNNIYANGGVKDLNHGYNFLRDGLGEDDIMRMVAVGTPSVLKRRQTRRKVPAPGQSEGAPYGSHGKGADKRYFKCYHQAKLEDLSVDERKALGLRADLSMPPPPPPKVLPPKPKVRLEVGDRKHYISTKNLSLLKRPDCPDEIKQKAKKQAEMPSFLRKGRAINDPRGNDLEPEVVSRDVEALAKFKAIEPIKVGKRVIRLG